jgi:transcriptional regulator with XRE-family HTH domain
MNAYSRALSAYLDPKGRPADRTQEALADQARVTQASISRYMTGDRFPDAETAQRIHDATDGHVPFDTWRSVAAEKFLGEAA